MYSDTSSSDFSFCRGQECLEQQASYMHGMTLLLCFPRYQPGLIRNKHKGENSDKLTILLGGPTSE